MKKTLVRITALLGAAVICTGAAFAAGEGETAAGTDESPTGITAESRHGRGGSRGL